MDTNCEKHDGGDPGLDQLMDNLPSNQGGAGRHKCPYCAYFEGLNKGIEDERIRIAAFLNVKVEELQP